MTVKQREAAGRRHQRYYVEPGPPAEAEVRLPQVRPRVPGLARPLGVCGGTPGGGMLEAVVHGYAESLSQRSQCHGGAGALPGLNLGGKWH